VEEVMADREAGGQRRVSRETEEVEETEVAPESDVRERNEKLTDDVDSILDEIDEVLEENAEEFVRGYIQKGGE
jgi:ubiquitin-like protein Pup